jgi:hypothetical protein
MFHRLGWQGAVPVEGTILGTGPGDVPETEIWVRPRGKMMNLLYWKHQTG